MAEILYESNYYGVSSLGDSLEHHGIKGQKWGVRRFQNPDGSLTALGKKRYGTVDNLRKAYEKKLFGKGKVLPEPPKPKPKVDPEKEKAKAIQDGDVKTILKYAGTMSTQELNEATNRAATIDRLKKMADTSVQVPAKPINNMSPAEAASKVNSLSTQEINDVLNRDNAKKRLAELIAPAKKEPKERTSAMERIQNAADKLSNFGNSIVRAKDTYDRLQKAFEPKEKEEKKSRAEELYDKWLDQAVKTAMDDARKKTTGTTKDKEFAAFMTAKNMAEGREEAIKKAAEVDKARKKAAARKAAETQKPEDWELYKKKYGITQARTWL